jgi:hypothetical protein
MTYTPERHIRQLPHLIGLNAKQRADVSNLVEQEGDLDRLDDLRIRLAGRHMHRFLA